MIHHRPDPVLYDHAKGIFSNFPNNIVGEIVMGSPENAKATNPTAKISRRHFIKYTGTIVFALGPSCYLFACDCQVPNSNLRNTDTGTPPSHGYLLVDVRKCQGCMSCMLACTLVHEGVQNPSLARIQIIQNPFESFPDDLIIAQCRQCVEPACVEACPENAISAPVAFGHVRVIDQKKCIGCGECQAACPFTPGRNKFEDFKTGFYNLQGWDTNSGYPNRGTLESLGLGYVADELMRHDVLGKG